MSPEELSNAIIALTGERMAKMESMLRRVANDTDELTVIVIKGNGEDPIRLRVRDIERLVGDIPKIKSGLEELNLWAHEQQAEAKKAADSKKFWGRAVAAQIMKMVVAGIIILAAGYLGISHLIPGA